MLPDNHPERIEELLTEINTERIRPHPPELKRWADRMLREYETKLQRVLGENAHQDYLLTHIKREKTKLQVPANSPQNPYDEERDTPLCTCGLECAIQSAEEPVEFRRNDDLDTAVRAFKRSHPGHPIVLDEARDAYYEDVAEVRDVLRLLMVAFQHDEIPDYGDSVAELRASLADRRDTGGDSDGGADTGGTAGGNSADDQIAAVASSRGE